MGYLFGLIRDVVISLALFSQWVLVGTLVDTITDAELATRRAASLYLAVSTLGVNAGSLFASFMSTGSSEEANKNQETLLGLFFEVVTSVQGWGMAFCAARLWSLEEDHYFMQDPFTYQLADSVFEMTLVQTGVGFANAVPLTTVAEKVVSWFTCMVGGVLTVNFFLASVILGRRAWWLLAVPSEETTPLVAAGVPAAPLGVRAVGAVGAVRSFGHMAVPALPGTATRRVRQ